MSERLVHLPAVLAGEFPGLSTSHARRLIAQGHVQLNGRVVTDIDVDLNTIPGDPVEIHVARDLTDEQQLLKVLLHDIETARRYGFNESAGAAPGGYEPTEVDSFLAYLHVMALGAVDNGWRLPGEFEPAGVFDCADLTIGDLEALRDAYVNYCRRFFDELTEETLIEEPKMSRDGIVAHHEALMLEEIETFDQIRSHWRLGWSY